MKFKNTEQLKLIETFVTDLSSNIEVSEQANLYFCYRSLSNIDTRKQLEAGLIPWMIPGVLVGREKTEEECNKQLSDINRPYGLITRRRGVRRQTAQ